MFPPPRWEWVLRSGPILPDEPGKATSIQDAEFWFEIYDKHVQDLIELAREWDLENELDAWIGRAQRRKQYWARARDRLRRQEGRGRPG